MENTFAEEELLAPVATTEEHGPSENEPGPEETSFEEEDEEDEEDEEAEEETDEETEPGEVRNDEAEQA